MLCPSRRCSALAPDPLVCANIRGYPERRNDVLVSLSFLRVAKRGGGIIAWTGIDQRETTGEPACIFTHKITRNCGCYSTLYRLTKLRGLLHECVSRTKISVHHYVFMSSSIRVRTSSSWKPRVQGHRSFLALGERSGSHRW